MNNEMTIEQFEAISSFDVFTGGTGSFPALNSEEDITWVAKKGMSNYAIYFWLATQEPPMIAEFGEKVSDEATIKEMVPVTEEVYELYAW